MIPIPLSRKRTYQPLADFPPPHRKAASSSANGLPLKRQFSKNKGKIPNSFKVTKTPQSNKKTGAFNLKIQPPTTNKRAKKATKLEVRHVPLLIVDDSSDDEVMEFTNNKLLIGVPEKIPKQPREAAPQPGESSKANQRKGKKMLVGGGGEGVDANQSNKYVLVGGVAENHAKANSCLLADAVPLLLVDASSDEEIIDLTGHA